MPRHKKKRKAVAVGVKRRDLLVGDLVVAKLRGHRPWPAQIQKPEDYGYEARPHRIFVTFFGTEETCFCSYNKITPFTATMRKSLAEQLQKINTNPELERAIKEIFAADDELKVTEESHTKSDEEEEQPPEPKPRKKPKLTPQEDMVVLEGVVANAVEVTRSTRAAAAAASVGQPSKQEKAGSHTTGASVKSLGIEQVQKLPRKVRIKVSTQTLDSADNPGEGGGTLPSTEKGSVSSCLALKSDVLSVCPRTETDADSERKCEVTPSSSPANEAPAAEAERTKNEDVEMEETAAVEDAADSEDHPTKSCEGQGGAEVAVDVDVAGVRCDPARLERVEEHQQQPSESGVDKRTCQRTTKDIECEPTLQEEESTINEEKIEKGIENIARLAEEKDCEGTAKTGPDENTTGTEGQEARSKGTPATEVETKDSEGTAQDKEPVKVDDSNGKEESERKLESAPIVDDKENDGCQSSAISNEEEDMRVDVPKNASDVNEKPVNSQLKESAGESSFEVKQEISVDEKTNFVDEGSSGHGRTKEKCEVPSTDREEVTDCCIRVVDEDKKCRSPEAGDKKESKV